MIEVHGLSKTYRVPVKEAGLAGSLKSLFARRYTEVQAVRELSFAIAQGERVGFLGPNGAGKTTTLKMLAGLLYPSAGELRVLGHRPQDREVAFLSQITLVMGQKQQLMWDLPPRETLLLNRAMYALAPKAYEHTLGELTELLGLAELLDRPTRNLSLGERMKCELAAALLHRPRVLFLDEPTIGLDVEMQVQVRHFIKEINEHFGATVLLTSHYMADIAALTPRLLVIDKGRLRFDGPLQELSERLAPERRLIVRGLHPELAALGFTQGEGEAVATVPPEAVNKVLAAVLERLPLANVRVEDTPLEEVLGRLFRSSDDDAEGVKERVEGPP